MEVRLRTALYRAALVIVSLVLAYPYMVHFSVSSFVAGFVVSMYVFWPELA